MDLDIKRVLMARPDPPQHSTLEPLSTVWGEQIDANHVLEEYPRPQFMRSSWQNLNGWWDYAIRECSDASSLWDKVRAPTNWDGRILVPFSVEAALSGVGRKLQPTQLLWYRREVTIRKTHETNRLLLHFEAVDYACAVYLNGTQVATHVGGYLPIDVDVTEVATRGSNTLQVCVYDPSEYAAQLRGKQRIVRGNMWYTAQSGIWQSVWLEEVASSYVVSASFNPDPDSELLCVEATVNVPGENLSIKILSAEGTVIATHSVLADTPHVQAHMQIAHPHLWSPEDPYLYSCILSYGDDEVQSYCAFRSVEVVLDDHGVARFNLNHKPLFVRGVLDQGYWPESLMTAPSDEALIADIAAMKAAGFNMLRKHIKIECRRWYWHCDRMGMLVWQDMVSGGDIPGEWTSANIPTLFRRTWSSRSDASVRAWKRFGAGSEAYRQEWLATAMDAMRGLYNHPCIGTWVVFNESWGQFASKRVVDELRCVDNTRPMIATSGWYDQGRGDYFAVHNYFRSMRVYKDPHAGILRHKSLRAFFINEFGGLTCPVKGHVSVPGITYGYDAFSDLGVWKNAFDDLLAQVDALEEQGLAGFVYTQLSDVEEETNGLLTYDRRVNKLCAEPLA